MTSNTFTSPQATSVDKVIENTLRPQTFVEMIGREKEKKILKMAIDAARSRNESLEHIIFYGPPGLGKTTFVHVIGKELGVNIVTTSGPAISSKGDIASILTNLGDGDILFIDEIHRLNKSIEEFLYPAMEDYCLDLTVGKGVSSKVIRVDLAKFTLIGATTRLGLLSGPMRDRFGHVLRLDFFPVNELSKMIERSSTILHFEIDSDASYEIARRSRGTARIANRLLKRVRDFAQVDGVKYINMDTAKQALNFLEVDELGLDDLDRKILLNIIEKFGGRPVGITTIAASVAEEVDTISDVYEPYLLQAGLINKTPKGRVATKRAYEHFNLMNLYKE